MTEVEECFLSEGKRMQPVLIVGTVNCDTAVFIVPVRLSSSPVEKDMNLIHV